MIYLIDDKINRQVKAGWDSEKFKEYEKYIVPIYSYSDMEDLEYRKNVFSSESVILFHESFFDNEVNIQSQDINDIRNKLEDFARDNPSAYYVSFSGSNNTRNLQSNAGSLPVNILYQNLEIFISSFKKSNKYDISFLFYGENHNIEKYLLSKLDLKKKDFDQSSTIETPSSKKTLFLRSRVDIQSPFGEETRSETIFNKDVEDIQLNEKIEKWFEDYEYDSIFLPISFGATLSDFNGLRLALHIRCTDTINRLKPIYIYSFVDHHPLITNDYFDILKTQNVFLIDYTHGAFSDAVLKENTALTIGKLPHEIGKINLTIPKNYDSSHSIANEWAIYKLIYSLPKVFYDDANRVINNIENNIYFKYLQTIFPSTSFTSITESTLLINNNNHSEQVEISEKPKILYIDNDYKKGWESIFKYIFKDLNKLNFSTLELDYRKISRDQIVERAINKVINPSSQRINYDIVLLDFRLCSADSIETDIDQVSGMQILKSLKSYNPGIQIIIFSATNKIWNLQAIQEAGADGFVIKESPENSKDEMFTVRSINSLMKSVEIASSRKYLKEVWNDFKLLISLAPEFEVNILIAFKLLYDSVHSRKYMNYAYLQLFLIVEEFISKDNIFRKDPNGSNYLVHNNNDYLIFDFIKKNGNTPVYKSAIKFKGGNYKIEVDNDFSRRLDTNAVVSSILIFRYGLQTSGEKDWTKIYNVRNEKAAHPEVGLLDYLEIKKLIDFLIFILDDKNVNLANIESTLEKPSFADQLCKLKNKFSK
ncbi:response regulator [Kaistella sp.]|uniref:response regulator n=1 Tax=Kaistella sp. TaxID=2782235 RepID=UPI00359FFFA5